MEHPSIIGHISSPPRTTAIPDTVMALPLINQPALGGIKEPGTGGRGEGRGGDDMAPRHRNLLILFPEGRRWLPSTYLAPRLVTGG